ncbi:MAG: GrlR family regulatory protein [Hyphomonadaceae bacterium]|nr:GrlR family regulatory protein [Hyphomonadaceae bacterium]
MLSDGLYRARFATPIGEGSGVVHFFGGGQIVGGDSGFSYVGRMKQVGPDISASIRVDQHDPGFASVFGPVTSFTINLTGREDRGTATLTGVSPHAPGVAFSVFLTPLAVPLSAAA